MRVGEKIRELRESKGLVLRKLAMALDIDTATMSKIEKGYRQARSIHITLLAEHLETDETELRIHWIADKLIQILDENGVNAIKSLRKAEEMIEKRNAS